MQQGLVQDIIRVQLVDENYWVSTHPSIFSVQGKQRYSTRQPTS
jgi:hypothetical protein